MDLISSVQLTVEQIINLRGCTLHIDDN